MERILRFIKHNLSFIWKFIEQINGIIFRILYKRRLTQIIPEVIEKFGHHSELEFRVLNSEDLKILKDFIERQNSADLKFFQPHKFDEKSLKKVYMNPAFLMMGAFNRKIMVGYFFLRFFFNRKCFVGRLVDREYRRKGIGKIMNNIMYNIAWSLNFKCMSTISKDNYYIMGAHSKNPYMIIKKEIGDNFLLVEFKSK